MKLTLLGSGAVDAVPVFGCDCSACSLARGNRRHARRPCSALLEAGETTVLLDAGRTDLAKILGDRAPSAILLTHYHVDHVQGLFELRWGRGASITVIGPDDPDGCADLHRHNGILDFSSTTTAFETFRLGDVFITPLPLNHSRPCLGYLFEAHGCRMAYLTDTVGLPETTTARLLAGAAVDLLILDCTEPPGDTPPRNHNSLTEALAIHRRLGAPPTVLTHIGHDLDGWLGDHPDQYPEGDIRIGRDWDCFTM